MQDTGHPGITPGCIFPCFLPENPSGVHFMYLYAPHDIFATKMMHTLRYTVSKIEANQTDGS